MAGEVGGEGPYPGCHKAINGDGPALLVPLSLHKFGPFSKLGPIRNISAHFQAVICTILVYFNHL